MKWSLFYELNNTKLMNTTKLNCYLFEPMTVPQGIRKSLMGNASLSSGGRVCLRLDCTV